MASYSFDSWWDDDEHADVLLRLEAHVPDATEATEACPVVVPRAAGGSRKRQRGSSEAGRAASSPARRATQNDDSSPTAPEQQQQQQHVKTYKLHTVILSAGSAYFKARLSKTWQSPAKGGPTGDASGSSGPCGIRHQLAEHVEEHEVEVWEHLLRLMYGIPLPEGSSVELLAQSLQLADRLEAVQCMDLLLMQLAAMVDAAADIASVLPAFVIPPGAASRPAAKVLDGAGKSFMLRCFGDVPAVINDDLLRTQFCMAPFACVLQWVRCDELQVHSENCVVYLLTAWVTSRQEGGRLVGSASLQKLANQVRVLHLGPAYQYQVLPNLRWFKDCNSMQHLPNLLMHKGVDSAGQPVFPSSAYPLLKWEGAKQWVAAPRKQCSTGIAGHLTWQVDAAQLKQLCKSPSPGLTSSHQVVNGMPIRLRLQATSDVSEPNKTIGLFCQVDRAVMDNLRLPWSISAMVKLDHVKFQVLGPDAANSKEITFKLGPMNSHGRGVGAFLKSSESPVTFEQLLAPYLVDRKLHIEAKFKQVDVA